MAGVVKGAAQVVAKEGVAEGETMAKAVAGMAVAG